jgi:hypothetical protein
MKLEIPHHSDDQSSRLHQLLAFVQELKDVSDIYLRQGVQHLFYLG